MVNKCAAPGFDTGNKRAKKNEDPDPSEEEHVSRFHFPSNEERMKIWESKVPREGFKATKYSVLCEKHFTPNDFQIESIDISNKMESSEKGENVTAKIKAKQIVSSANDEIHAVKNEIIKIIKRYLQLKRLRNYIPINKIT